MTQVLEEIQTLEERLARIEQQRDEHGFGDAPEAEYVEPKPPGRKQTKSKHRGAPALKETMPGTSYVKPEPPDKYPRSPHYGAASCRVQFHTSPAESKNYFHKGRSNKSKPLTFSGSSKEPEDYLQWESNMEYWLRTNHIPKDEKLSYAVDSLIGEAYKWFLKEDTPTFFKRSRVLDWEDLKARMYQEFVKKHRAYSHNAKTSMYQKASRSIPSAPKMLSTRGNHHTYLTEHKRMSSNDFKKQLEVIPTVRAKEVQQEVPPTPMRTTKPLREPQVTLGPGTMELSADTMAALSKALAEQERHQASRQRRGEYVAEHRIYTENSQDQLLMNRQEREQVSNSLHTNHSEFSKLSDPELTTFTFIYKESLVSTNPPQELPSAMDEILQECQDTIQGDNPKNSPPICGEENQLQTCQEDIGEDFEPEPPDYALDNAKSMCEEEGDSEIKANETHIIFENELGRHGEEPEDKELVKVQNVMADSTQEKLSEKVTTTQSVVPHGKKKQCKSYRTLNEPTCYRRHKIGHFVIICPSRQFMEGTSLGQELKPSKGSKNLIQSSFEISNSRLMHLSLPKGIDAGSKEKLEELLEKEERIGKKSNFFVKAAEDLGDVFPKYSSRSFPLIRGKEHQIVFDPGTLVETFPYDIQNKQGKEIIVADAIIPRYVFLVVPEAKLLEFEYIMRLYDSNDNFKNVFPSCEEFEYKKFFRHGGFLFDKTCEVNRNYLLMSNDKFTRASNASNNAELFFGEIVYFDSTLNFNKHLGDHAERLKTILNYLSENLFAIQSNYTFCTYDLVFRVFVSTQGIQEESHVNFKLGYQFWIRMKEKRFPVQEGSKRTQRGSCPFRVKEHIKDNALILAEICLSIYSDSMTVIIHLLFAQGVDNFAGTKEEPPDIKRTYFHFFARTGIGDAFTQDKKPLEYFRMIFEVGERIWTPRIDGPFHQTRRISDNAYKLKLQGKYDISSSFNVSDLLPYIADTDLRTNPFQEGGDDMIVDSKGAKEHEAEEEPVIVGRITRSRAKEMAKEAHSLIAEGSINLPMIQVFNITTMETAPGNDN